MPKIISIKSAEMIVARREWNDILKVLQKKLSQELYPVKPSFRNESESLKTINIKKKDLIVLTSFCLAKETINNNNNNEKTTYGMGENTCKWCDKQGLNLQNIQTAHTT